MYQNLMPKVGGSNLPEEVKASGTAKVSSRLHLAIILLDRNDGTNPSTTNIQGQMAFARAVEFLLAKGTSLEGAIKLLHSKNDMYLQNKTWHHILWNPVAEKMLNNWSPAETLLLVTAGEGTRTKTAEDRLRQLQRGAKDDA
jgi:hypothetical protein